MAISIKITPVNKDGTLDQYPITLTGALMPETCTPEPHIINGPSYRTVLGDFIGFPIGTERKLIFKWKILLDSQIDYIYYDGIEAAMDRTKTSFYKIEVLYEQGNTKGAELKKKLEATSSDGIFYLGDKPLIDRLFEYNTTTAYSLELHFIQKNSHKINSIQGMQ